jgi:S-adenosylmethionine:tRNA ribosyltransferase-isomerase
MDTLERSEFASLLRLRISARGLSPCNALRALEHSRVRTADFDYALPPQLIAQAPAPERDHSRLLVLHRHSRHVEHRRFGNFLEYLNHGDVLVLNNSKVIPARLHGMNVHTGGRFEILLLDENATNDWWVMLRPGKRARTGTQIVLVESDGQPSTVHATVLDKNDEGHRRLEFGGTSPTGLRPWAKSRCRLT